MVTKYNVVAIDNVIYSIQILSDDILMIITWHSAEVFGIISVSDGGAAAHMFKLWVF